MLTGLTAASLLAAVSFAPLPQQPASDEMALVRQYVDAAAAPGARWPRFPDVAGDLRRLYDAAQWTSLWLADGRPSRQSNVVVQHLLTLDDVGLPPADYDAAALDSLRHRLAVGTGGVAERARFEILLTLSVSRVLAALHWGRINPRDAHEAFRVPHDDYDLAVGVRTAARAASPLLVFEGAEPRFLHYRLLKNELLRYRALARDTTILPLPAFTRLRPDDGYTGAPALRRLLVVLGDLPPESDQGPDPDTVYTGDLVEGIKRFQARNGELQDGIIGPATRALLNRPFAQRVEQIALALERWRWLPREFRGRVIIVNIPEFRLHAFDRLTSDSTAVFSMDVVVGSAYDHSTPVFMKDLEYLVFSPYWEVPTSIARNEIRPRAMRDPGYLVRNGYVLARSYAENPPAVPPTPENIAAIGRAVRVRQRPGDNNSLGRVKFMLPNPHNIYLHDTPVQSAFERVRRDVSHGCIRLADPRRLAEWLLHRDTTWTRDRIDSVMARSSPLTVPLAERVPVLIVYSTAVAERNGTMRFLPDIYGHDVRLHRLLARGYPYPR